MLNDASTSSAIDYSAQNEKPVGKLVAAGRIPRRRSSTRTAVGRNARPLPPARRRLIECGHRFFAGLSSIESGALLPSDSFGVTLLIRRRRDGHLCDRARCAVRVEDPREVTLVGHSFGGAVITGAADRVPGRVAQVVYLDAEVPRDGAAEMDLLPPAERSA